MLTRALQDIINFGIISIFFRNSSELSSAILYEVLVWSYALITDNFWNKNVDQLWKNVDALFLAASNISQDLFM